jgi:hypothetical protein
MVARNGAILAKTAAFVASYGGIARVARAAGVGPRETACLLHTNGRHAQVHGSNYAVATIHPRQRRAGYPTPRAERGPRVAGLWRLTMGGQGTGMHRLVGP